MMHREFMHMIGERPDDPLVILMVASMFRDELPWIYELGNEAYQMVKNGRPDASSAMRRFRRAAEMLMHGPMMEEFDFDPRMIDMALHELERYSSREAEDDSDSKSNE